MSLKRSYNYSQAFAIKLDESWKRATERRQQGVLLHALLMPMSCVCVGTGMEKELERMSERETRRKEVYGEISAGEPQPLL